MEKDDILKIKVGIIGLTTEEVTFVNFSLCLKLGILAIIDKPYLRTGDPDLSSVY